MQNILRRGRPGPRRLNREQLNLHVLRPGDDLDELLREQAEMDLHENGGGAEPNAQEAGQGGYFNGYIYRAGNAPQLAHL